MQTIADTQNIINLRDIEPADIKYFAKWWRDRELIALTSGDFEPRSDSEIETYFDKKLKDRNAIHKMICLQGQAIGQVSLVKLPDNIWEIQIVIGNKAEWDKGYGSEAIRQMLNIASQEGIGEIRLEVRPDNLRAIRVYEKNGFKKSKLGPSDKNLIRMNLKLSKKARPF